MFDRPRNWKWMVPAALIAPCLIWWNDWAMRDGTVWGALALFPLGLTVILSIASLINLYLYVRDHVASIVSEEISSRNYTPSVRMLEAAKEIHPEVLRMVLGERARRWGLVSGSKSPTGEPYAVLLSRPRVTDVFIVHFLKMSNKTSYMTKRLLSDGDKSWDPQRIVTAYEMYDDLESLLVEELKCTRPFGVNKPGYWLGDWEPISVGLDFGVDIEEWEDGGDQRTAVSGQQSAVSGQRSAVSEADILARAMEGLEQTQAMKARMQGR